jgi:hypothetical protein
MSSDHKQKNRRRSRRARARTSVKLQCREGAFGLGADLAYAVLDVSESGACLILRQPVAEQAEVEIIIEGYGMKSIKRLGHVRRQVKLDDGKCCIGVEFQKPLPYRDWLTIAVPE